MQQYTQSVHAQGVWALCGSLLAQFKDQSAETLWLKLTAVWEMTNGAGTHTRTHTVQKRTPGSDLHLCKYRKKMQPG